MKTLQYLFFGSMATMLMAADCSNKDNEFYNDVFVSSVDLVDVEDQPFYVTGDVLWVNTDNFGRRITELGQNTELDVYGTSGGATSFTFSYLLEKENASGGWDLVTIDEADVETARGISTSYGEFVQALATFDTELQSYEYRGGIRLNQPGHYRLSFTYNSGVTDTVVLTSNSTDNNLYVNIFSGCEDIAGSGYYTFNVN